MCEVQKIIFSPSEKRVHRFTTRQDLNAFLSLLFSSSYETLCSEFEYFLQSEGAFSTGLTGTNCGTSKSKRKLVRNKKQSTAGGNRKSGQRASSTALFTYHDPVTFSSWLQDCVPQSESALRNYFQNTIKQIQQQLDERLGGPSGGMIGQLRKNTCVSLYYIRAALLRFYLDHTPPLLVASLDVCSEASAVESRALASWDAVLRMIMEPLKRKRGKVTKSVEKKGITSFANDAYRSLTPTIICALDDFVISMLCIDSSSGSSATHVDGGSKKKRSSTGEAILTPSESAGKISLLRAAVSLVQLSTERAEQAFLYMLHATLKALKISVEPSLCASSTTAWEPNLSLPSSLSLSEHQAYWKHVLLAFLYLVPQKAWSPQSVTRLSSLLLDVSQFVQSEIDTSGVGKSEKLSPSLDYTFTTVDRNKPATTIRYRNACDHNLSSPLGSIVLDRMLSGELAPVRLLKRPECLPCFNLNCEQVQPNDDSDDELSSKRFYGEITENLYADSDMTTAKLARGNLVFQFMHTKKVHVAVNGDPRDSSLFIGIRKLGYEKAESPKSFASKKANDGSISLSFDTGGPYELFALNEFKASFFKEIPSLELSGSVRVEVSCTLQTGLNEELHEALLAALLSVAKGLKDAVLDLRDKLAPYQEIIPGELQLGEENDPIVQLKFFSQGVHQNREKNLNASNQSSRGAEASEEKGSSVEGSNGCVDFSVCPLASFIQGLSDEELRKKVPCSLVMLPVVRAELQVLACWTSCRFKGMRAEEAWETVQWKAIMRRVSLASDAFGKPPSASVTDNGRRGRTGPLPTGLFTMVGAVACMSHRSHTELSELVHFLTSVYMAELSIQKSNKLPEYVTSLFNQFYTDSTFSIEGMRQTLADRKRLVECMDLLFTLVKSICLLSSPRRSTAASTTKKQKEGDCNRARKNAREIFTPAYLTAGVQLMMKLAMACDFTKDLEVKSFIAQFLKGCPPLALNSLQYEFNNIICMFLISLRSAVKNFAHCFASLNSFILDEWVYGPFGILVASLLSFEGVMYPEDEKIRVLVVEILREITPVCVLNKPCKSTWNSSDLVHALRVLYTHGVPLEKVHESPILLLCGKYPANGLTFRGSSRFTYAVSEAPVLLLEKEVLLASTIRVRNLSSWKSFQIGLTAELPPIGVEDFMDRPFGKRGYWPGTGPRSSKEPGCFAELGVKCLQYFRHQKIWGRGKALGALCQSHPLRTLGPHDELSISFTHSHDVFAVWKVNGEEVARYQVLQRVTLWVVVGFYDNFPCSDLEVDSSVRMEEFQCSILPEFLPRKENDGSLCGSTVAEAIRMASPSLSSGLFILSRTITPYRLKAHFMLLTQYHIQRNDRLPSSSQGLCSSIGHSHRISASSCLDASPKTCPSPILLSHCVIEYFLDTIRCFNAYYVKKTETEESSASADETSCEFSHPEPPSDQFLNASLVLANLTLASVLTAFSLVLDDISEESLEKAIQLLTEVLRGGLSRLLENVQFLLFRMIHSLIRLKATRPSNDSYDPLPLWELCKQQYHKMVSSEKEIIFSERFSLGRVLLSSDKKQVGCESAFPVSYVGDANMRIVLNDAEKKPCDISVELFFSDSLSYEPGMKQNGFGLFCCIGDREFSANSSSSNIPLSPYIMDYGFRLKESLMLLNMPSEKFKGKAWDQNALMYRCNWASAKNKLIFASGDTLTMRIIPCDRTVGFFRNGLYLGPLFRIPKDVEVVTPFVALSGNVTTARWISPIKESKVQLLWAMREALHAWPKQLLPSPKKLLSQSKEEKVLGLILLGADGDEHVVYHKPQQISCDTGIVRRESREFPFQFIERFSEMACIHGFTSAVVTIEKANSTGALETVHASELIPCCHTFIPLPLDVWSSALPALIRDAISLLIPIPTGLNVVDPGMVLRLLRLLATAPASTFMESNLKTLIVTLLERLSMMARVQLPPVPAASPSYLQQMAWNQLKTSPESSSSLKLHFPSSSALYKEKNSLVSGAPSDASTVGEWSHQLCPDCEKPLVDCKEESHCPGLTRCMILDAVLRGQQAHSPYTGLTGRWSGENTFIEISPIELSDPETSSAPAITATGESSQGAYRITAQQDSPISFSGTVWFESFTLQEKDSAGFSLDQEWICSACTLRNDGGCFRCAACNGIRVGAVWKCSRCRSESNPITEQMCSLCGGARQVSQPSNTVVEWSFCTQCGIEKVKCDFKTLQLFRFCPRCDSNSRWLPVTAYKGRVVGHVVGNGDQLELLFLVADSVHRCEQLKSESFSFLSMAQACAEVKGSGNQAIPDEKAAELLLQKKGYMEPLCFRSRYAPAEFSVPETAANEESEMQSNAMLLHAMAFYAFQIIFQNAPTYMPLLFALYPLPALDAAWLQSLSEIKWNNAKAAFDSYYHAISSLRLNDSTLRGMVLVVDQLMFLFPELRSYQVYLLRKLAQMGNTASRATDVALECIVTLLEGNVKYGARVNRRSLACPALLPHTSTIAGRRAVLLAEVQKVDTGCSDSLIQAQSALVRCMQCMENCTPMLQVLEMDPNKCFAVPIKLSETRVNESGFLLSGQLRGSAGVAAAAGGKFYYEVMMPLDGVLNCSIMLGWGSREHEQQNSRQHVGSDMYSWGFNCHRRLQLMEESHDFVPQRPIVGGDVVGALLDLDNLMMTWSVNGEAMTWVSVPLQGIGEKIYPYVSAFAFSPIQMRLTNTLFKPEGYKDFSSSAMIMKEAYSNLKPQSYAFYKELVRFYEEDMGQITSSLQTCSSGASPHCEQLLLNYPLIQAALASHHTSLGTMGPTTELSEEAETQRQLKIRNNIKSGEHIIADKDSSTIFPVVSPTSPPSSSSQGETLGEVKESVSLRNDIGKNLYFAPLDGYIKHLQGMNSITVIAAQQKEVLERSPLLSRYWNAAQGLLLSKGRWALFRMLSRIEPQNELNLTVEIDMELANKATASALTAQDLRPRGKAVKGWRAHAPASLSAAALSSSVISLLKDSITGQLFSQTENTNVFMHAVMFRVELKDSIAVDGGGVARSLMSAVSAELNFRVVQDARVDPVVPLFILSPHSTSFTCVPNLPYFNSIDITPEERDLFSKMLIWLGKIMGNITLCGRLKLPLNFPRMVWKYLTFEEATITDYFSEIDSTVRHVLDDPTLLQNSSLMELLPESVKSPVSFSAYSPFNDRAMANSTPMSSPYRTKNASSNCLPSVEENVLEEGRESPEEPSLSLDLARAKIKHRLLHQYDAALSLIRKGMLSVLPEASLRTIRWDDLKSRICGSSSLNADDVLKFMDCSRLPVKIASYFSEVLRELTDTQLSQFLLFCSGQSCLPLPGTVFLSCGDDPKRAPTSRTCFPISIQLQPYKNKEKMREMILLCLNHSKQFGIA